MFWAEITWILTPGVKAVNEYQRSSPVTHAISDSEDGDAFARSPVTAPLHEYNVPTVTVWAALGESLEAYVIPHPSSNNPSQSSFIPLQVSVAPGFIAELLSLQSVELET